MSSFGNQGMTDADRNDHRQKTFPKSFWSGPIVRARFDQKNLGREKQRKGCPVPRAERPRSHDEDCRRPEPEHLLIDIIQLL
jgi:hypothetical protein